jgi:hypothetical protein
MAAPPEGFWLFFGTAAIHIPTAEDAKQKDGSLGTLLFGAANGFNYFLLTPSPAFFFWK